MRLFILSTVLTSIALAAIREDVLSKKSKGARLSPNEIKKIEQMHYGWYVQAVSGLLGAMGKELYMKMNKKNRKAFVACLNSIDTEHDIKSGAGCLVKAFDGELITSFPEAFFSPQYDFVGKVMPETKFTLRNSPKKIKFKEEMKRILKKKAIKQLFQQTKSMKKQKKPIRLIMSQEQRESNHWFRRRFRRNILSLYTNDEAKKEAKRIDKLDSPWKVKTLDRFPSLIDTPSHRSPVKTITDLLGGIVRLVKNQTTDEQKTLHKSYDKLTELQDIVSSKTRDSQFKYRMLDMVLGKNNPLRRKKTFTERFQDIVPKGLVDKSVYGLVDTVAKHSKDVNYNLLSPRFFPLLPDKYSNKKPILSPNFFPMYKDDSENSILPIPELLEKSGMRKQDRTNVLELILDASGVNEVVDDALRIVKNLGATGLGKDIMDITNALDGAFVDLHKSFTKRQKRDLSARKYTFMNKDQLLQMYGENGIYNNTITNFPFDIDEYSQLRNKEKYESLKETVRLLAEENNSKRRKRTIEIRIFKHTTLAPYGFSPTINAFSILGPLVLSPNIFSPSVIGPLLLSPPIISPQIGDPLILSPYFLGPNTISAAIFNAYVLSPYVLSPNVVNPYVLSPLILSPYVLCPDVLSPTILSGAILSPSVASPAVFTESALAAAVLSPSIFS